MANTTLYIIDALSQIFKAYHAIRNMSHNGRSTNATFGFCQIFQRLLKTQQPEHLVVAFDLPGSTFRHTIYPLYKANRPAPPEDLGPQIEDVVRVLEAMRIPIASAENYETRLSPDQLARYQRFRTEIDTLRRHLETEGLLRPSPKRVRS